MKQDKSCWQCHVSWPDIGAVHYTCINCIYSWHNSIEGSANGKQDVAQFGVRNMLTKLGILCKILE